MFMKLFERPSDVVYHTIGPYAAERERFMEHCRGSGFARTCLQQAAGKTPWDTSVRCEIAPGRDLARARIRPKCRCATHCHYHRGSGRNRAGGD